VSGLNFHANTVDLHVEPTAAGEAPVVRALPRSSYYTLQNRALTGTTQTLWATRRPDSAVLMLAGRVQQGTVEPLVLSLPDPPMFLGVTLADRLRAAGVAVGQVGRMGLAESLPAGELLHTVQTPLTQVITRCNKDSQNLYAESLLKRLGRQLSGAAGSWPTGVAALRDFLQKRFGVQAARVQAQDGSGLSAGNRVTARVTVELLRSMHRDPALKRLYRDSLAEGGKDGSLGAKNFDAASITSRLHAKTGFINGVRSLSGYLVHTRPDGRERVIGFSMYFNDDKPGVYGHVIRDLRNRMVQLIDQKTR
jgi:D-alanyl-D-alanine carboxypeptidase/D-alanyl-D-alanine-endopeptidase (penicillin-binding protein 4)